MKLAIIAAGEGSRLREEGILTPKPLLMLKGETLLMRHIRRAAQHGFSSVAVIVNAIYPELAEYLESTNFPIPIEKIVKTTEGSMHSFYELRNFLRNEPFLLTTVDPVFKEVAFNKYIKTIKENHDACGVMALTSYVDDEKPLWVTTNPNMRIVSYSSQKGDAQWVSAGFYYFKPEVIPLLESAMAEGMVRMRNFQQYLLDKRCTLMGCDVGKVIDIDHVEDIAKAEEMLDD
ncbi:MAG: NDP-sugar synthase [Bacteroidales bacterium]|nr:NDP-sugar synthase [Bacteroidales bacterium]